MKNLLFTILLSLTSIYLTAQIPSILWQKSLGGSGWDHARSIQQTTDGGYIVTGVSYSIDGDVTGNHGNEDYWVVKLDSTGTIEWQKCLGGSGVDYAYSIQQTTDGGYVVSGLSNSIDGDIIGNQGAWDCWVVKLSSIGTIEWKKSLGGTDHDAGRSILQTTDGGYVVAGQTRSINGDVTGNHGYWDYLVIKLSSIGIITWQKCLGGSGGDNAASIQQTTDGGYIVAGDSDSNDGDVTGYHGDNDYWVVKLDSTGTIEWKKSLGGSGVEWANSTQQTLDGGYVVAGISNSTNGDVTGNHGGYDYWVVKLSSIGTIEWKKSLGGTGEDEANSIKQTTDGGYVVAGRSNSIDGDVTGNHGGNDCWVVKLSSIGTIEWKKSLGGTGEDEANSIQQTTDGGYVVAGWSNSTDGDVTGNHGNRDYWVVKLSPIKTGIDIQNACNSFTWIDGISYFSSTNTPTFTMIRGSINGYDSIVTLNLTINNLAANYSTIDNGGGNYSFTNTSNGNVNQSHWAFGDGTISTLTNPTHTFNANGTYVVVLTVNDSTVSSSCMDYYFDTIVVSGVVAPFQCAAGFVMYPDAGDVTVVNSSTGTNLTYLWDFGDGNTSNVQFPTHTYATTGNYYLCLTIDDGVGCVDMYCDSIGENGVVFNKKTGFVINVIDPLLININEQDALASGVTMYPNPTNNQITLKANHQFIGAFYTIYDNMGKSVLSGQINAPQMLIELGNLSGGIYLLSIGEHKQSFKVIKN